MEQPQDKVKGVFTAETKLRRHGALQTYWVHIHFDVPHPRNNWTAFHPGVKMALGESLASRLFNHIRNKFR